MSKRGIIYMHIFIWLFAFFANLPFDAIARNTPPYRVITSFIAFFYLMGLFYLFYLYLVPLFLNKKKLAEFFLFSFLVVLFMPFVGYSILFVVRAIFDGTFHDFYRGYSFKMHMSGYYPVLTAAVFGSFFRVIINWFSSMNQKTELDRQKLIVELDLIKSKLSPHFLFNTLNNIDSLIQNDPEKASETLVKLSEMMRYMTYETSAEYVDLLKEIGQVKNLVELHGLRIKTPEGIRTEFTGDMTTKIAPALFVPLIENAFKFAALETNKPRIDISLSSEKGIVEFRISNNYQKNSRYSRKTDSGFGIINLKKRLELTYPGKYNLVIDPGESVFRAKLTVDTNGN